MSHEISHQQSREEYDLGNHFEKKPKRDQGERISRPPERKSLDLVKQEATRAEEKKHEAWQKEHIDAYVKKVLAIFKYRGGIFNNMSVQFVEKFMAKGAEYGGWLRLMSREDIQDLSKMVQQDKLSLSHFCPADIKTLREMEEAARVEAGQGRGKDHFEPWIGHKACNEYGKPVAGTVHLATESTPEKPILPGKGYNGPFDNTFRDSLSLSDTKIRKLRAGKDISTVLSPYEYQQYQKKFGQSSASSERQGASRESENNRNARSSREVIEAESESEVSEAESDDNRSTRSSDREVSEAESEREVSEAESEEPSYKRESHESALEPLEGYHPYFPVRYPSDSGREVYRSGIPRGCAINTAMMILRDQEKYNVCASEVEDFYSNCDMQETSNRNYTPSLLRHFGSVPYEYKEHLSLSDLQDRLKTGYSIIASISYFNDDEEDWKNHSVVVDKIETDDYGYAQYIHIRDSREPDPYKVTIDAWEKAWNRWDVVPVISDSDDDSQEETSYSPPPQATWNNSYPLQPWNSGWRY